MKTWRTYRFHNAHPALPQKKNGKYFLLSYEVGGFCASDPELSGSDTLRNTPDSLTI